MIGIRPSTRRKSIEINPIMGRKLSFAFSKLEKMCRGESQVAAWNMDIHSAGDKYAKTWERRKGYKYPQRVRKKRGAIKTISAPDGDANEKEHMDALDYGNTWKIVLRIPSLCNKEDIGVELIKKKGYMRITAPGFSKDLPLLKSNGFNGNVDWNYKNGILEINQRKHL